MYSPRISEHFKQNPKSLTHFSLMLHMYTSIQFVSFAVVDGFKINELRVRIKLCLEFGKNAMETNVLRMAGNRLEMIHVSSTCRNDDVAVTICEQTQNDRRIDRFVNPSRVWSCDFNGKCTDE